MPLQVKPFSERDSVRARVAVVLREPHRVLDQVLRELFQGRLPTRKSLSDGAAVRDAQ